VSLSKGSEWAGGGVVRFGRRRFRMGLWSRRGEELRELNYRLPVESEAEQHLSRKLAKLRVCTAEKHLERITHTWI